MRAWLVLALLAGCYNPTVAPGAPCQTSADCPSTLACVAGVCGGSDTMEDATVVVPPADAMVDAYVPDGVVLMTTVLGDDVSEVRDVEIWIDSVPNMNDSDHFSVDGDAHGLLWFDLTSIASTRTITSATLRLPVTDFAATMGGTATIHRLREAWVETEATWLNRTATQAWSVTGARSPASDAQPVASFLPAALNTAYDVTLPASLVQDWIDDPAINYGLVIQQGDATQHVHIGTRESGNFARLTVEYY